MDDKFDCSSEGKGEAEVEKEVNLYFTTRTPLQTRSLCELNKDLIHITVVPVRPVARESEARGKEELI